MSLLIKNYTVFEVAKSIIDYVPMLPLGAFLMRHTGYNKKAP